MKYPQRLHPQIYEGWFVFSPTETNTIFLDSSVVASKNLPVDGFCEAKPPKARSKRTEACEGEAATMRRWRDVRMTVKHSAKHTRYSSIAQSVERMTVNHDVTGSSPVRGATCMGL